MNVLEALRDRGLFGGLPAFRDLATWEPWLAFLRAVYGLPLSAGDLETFRRHTGRSVVREGGYREAVCIVGRQSGKSRIAALVAGFEAVMASREADRTELYAVLVAQDHRAALRTLFRYATAPFETVPILVRSVQARTAGTLNLESGVVLTAYPCRPASVRGLRARVVVIDELAFFTGTDGNPTDREMLRAVRPCLATTGGRLLILSSPYGQTGALWDLHRQHFGRDDSPVLIWQASASEMNATLPSDYLERMREEDPEAYRSEVLGEFRSGLSTLFDAGVLEDATDAGRRESPPEPDERSYAAHFDASGGRADAAALAVGHREGDLVRVDLVRRWPAPHNPEAVIGEAADILGQYRVASVQIDRFGGDFPLRAFERHLVHAEVAASTTVQHYLGLLPLVNAGRVRLVDDPTLLRELRMLERRTGMAGRDRVDHRRGEHDDAAAAVAGVVSVLGAHDPGDLGITF